MFLLLRSVDLAKSQDCSSVKNHHQNVDTVQWVEALAEVNSYCSVFTDIRNRNLKYFSLDIRPIYSNFLMKIPLVFVCPCLKINPDLIICIYLLTIICQKGNIFYKKFKQEISLLKCFHMVSTWFVYVRHSQHGQHSHWNQILYLLWAPNLVFEYVTSLLLTLLVCCLHPGDVPIGTDLLTFWQWCIIMTYCHQLSAATFTFLPVYQLVCGHRIPSGIKWHSITFVGKFLRTLVVWEPVKERKTMEHIWHVKNINILIN